MSDPGANPRILLVDDDPAILEVLAMRLASEGYTVVTASSGEEALGLIATTPPDAVVSDLRMAEVSGLDLLEAVHRRWPAVPVIILTAHGDITSAVKAIRNGAFDFLEKPYDGMKLVGRIRAALRGRSAAPPAGATPATAPFVAVSPAMREVWRRINRLARVDSTVLITGDTGTGKEVVARALHNLSGRRRGPFRAINCGAIPSELLESELFGHERGAFTGAHAARRGLFRAAHGGTLLLDEIGDAPIETQVKLLRVLQEREVVPVGGVEPVAVDVRVIAATHQNLRRKVAEGDFREDLYYRIDVLPLHLLPLRERREDIIPLVRHFLTELAGGRSLELSPPAIRRLEQYPWPGNVRELRNRVEVAVALSDGDRLEADDFALKASSLEGPATGDLTLMPMRDARAHFDRDYLIRVLRASGGNVTRAAEMAGKHRTDFYALMKRHSLKRSDFC